MLKKGSGGYPDIKILDGDEFFFIPETITKFYTITSLSPF